MTPYYPDFMRHNPGCEPDWRWFRALSLVEDGRRFSPHRDDGPTGRALQYLQAEARSGGEEYDAEVHAARKIFEGGGNERTMIEARTLARQTPAGIPKLGGLPADFVR